mmetsp:Transcript_29653/g.71289  ORF Transcript_29653/g.71289 Transcript_29653/m.71289 type:complete len:683 (-) Transcript_29653:737-2785(-)
MPVRKVVGVEVQQHRLAVDGPELQVPGALRLHLGHEALRQRLGLLLESLRGLRRAQPLLAEAERHRVAASLPKDLALEERQEQPDREPILAAVQLRGLLQHNLAEVEPVQAQLLHAAHQPRVLPVAALHRDDKRVAARGAAEDLVRGHEVIGGAAAQALDHLAVRHPGLDGRGGVLGPDRAEEHLGVAVLGDPLRVLAKHLDVVALQLVRPPQQLLRHRHRDHCKRLVGTCGVDGADLLEHTIVDVRVQALRAARRPDHLVVLELEKLLAELVVLAQPLVVVLQDDHVAPRAQEASRATRGPEALVPPARLGRGARSPDARVALLHDVRLLEEGRAGDGAVVGGSEGVLLFLDDESVGEAVELLGALVGVGDRDVERRGPAEEEQREDALLGLAGDEREALLLQAVPEGVDVEALGGRRAPAVERAVRCVLGAEELRRVRAVEAPGVDVRQHRHPLHRQEVHAAGALGLRALDQALHVAVRRLLKHLGRHRLAPPRVRGPRHDLVHQPLADQHPLVVVHRRRQHQPVGGAVEVQELLQAHVAHREAVHAQLRLLRQEQDALSGGPKHRLDHHLATAEQAVRLDKVVDRGAHVALGHADGRVDLLDHRGLVGGLDVAVQDALVPVLLDPLQLLAEDRHLVLGQLLRPANERVRDAVRHERVLLLAGRDDAADLGQHRFLHVVV